MDHFSLWVKYATMSLSHCFTMSTIWQMWILLWKSSKEFVKAHKWLLEGFHTREEALWHR